MLTWNEKEPAIALLAVAELFEKEEVTVEEFCFEEAELPPLSVCEEEEFGADEVALLELLSFEEEVALLLESDELLAVVYKITAAWEVEEETDELLWLAEDTSEEELLLELVVSELEELPEDEVLLLELLELLAFEDEPNDEVLFWLPAFANK